MHKTFLYIIVVVSIVVSLGTLTYGHGWGDDFASYIMQADAIVNGRMSEFVQRNSITIFESSFQIGPVAYPWGYPLILAPVYALKGNSPFTLKLPTLVFFAGFLVGLYYLWKQGSLTDMESLLLVTLFAFNPVLITFLDQILSDIPFLFFSILALTLARMRSQREVIQYALLGLMIAVSWSIRTTGILLLASFLFVNVLEIWRNRRDQNFYKNGLRKIVIVSGAFGVAWLLYALIFPGGAESYFAQYQPLHFGNVLAFASSYFYLFQVFFGEEVIWEYVYYVLFIFFLIGLWVRRKEDVLFIVFFVLWMLLLITWPSWQGTRFILPLFPIFIYFVFQGMKYVLHMLPSTYQQFGRTAIFSFWIVVIVFFVYVSATNAYINIQNGRSMNGAYDVHSMEMYTFIREKTSPESIIIFFKPRAMRLMTDRDSIMSAECNRMLLGDYIVLSTRTKIAENHQIHPMDIASCKLPLKEVFKNGRFIIYEIEEMSAVPSMISE